MQEKVPKDKNLLVKTPTGERFSLPFYILRLFCKAIFFTHKFQAPPKTTAKTSCGPLERNPKIHNKELPKIYNLG